MRIAKRIRELPIPYNMPSHCPQCGKWIGFYETARIKWVVYGEMDEHCKGFCSVKCAREFMANNEGGLNGNT